MIYFSFFDVLKALSYSFAFGAFLCVCSAALDIFVDFFGNIRRIPLELVKYSDTGKSVCVYFKKKVKMECEESRKTYILKDLLFALLSGFTVSILFYVASDGIPRLYILFAVWLSYELSKKTLGRFIYAVVLRIFRSVLKLLTLLLLLVIFPFRRFFTLLFRYIVCTVRKITQRIHTVCNSAGALRK